MKTVQSLEHADIKLKLPGISETITVLQRNAEVDRSLFKNKNSSPDNCLTADGAALAHKIATQKLSALLKACSPKERSSIDILIVASDPHIGTDNSEHPESQRALHTAEQVLQAAREVMGKFGMDEGQLLNNSAVEHGGVAEITEIKDFSRYNDWPELLEYFSGKASKTREDVAELYNNEEYRDEREKLGVESAASVAKRMEQFMSFARGSANYHHKNAGRRLLFWAVTHFDTISPYLGVTLAHPAEWSELIGVGHLGGTTIHIKKDKSADIMLFDRPYRTKHRYTIVSA